MQPDQSISRIMRVPALVTSVSLALIDLLLGIGTNFVGLLICTAAMVLLFHPYRRTPLGAVLLFTGASMYFMPLLALIYVQVEPLNVAFFALYNLVGFAFLVFGINQDGSDKGAPELVKSLSSGMMDVVMVPILLTLGLLGTNLGAVGGAIFLGAWGMSLVHMERLMRTRQSPVAGWIAGFFILIFILVFAVVIWDGFGRLVLISLALGPVFLATRFTRIQIPALLLAGLGVALVFIGRALRFGASEGIAGLAEDSGASHLVLSSELWQVPSLTQWVTSFWEQFVLLFFNWAPRTVWPDKPLGVNLTFVDAYLGRDGISEEHSTALGYFGELVFYSPNLWPLLVIFVTAVIILVRRGIAYLSGAFTTGTMLFDLWLITLFWGGMASFGARVWLGLLPSLVYMFMLRSFDGPPSAHRLSVNATPYGDRLGPVDGVRE